MLVNRIKAPSAVPLRVDFAGGWLDVPRYARKGSYVVNCAITPMVSLCEWPYEKRSGLGGSGAWAMLEGRDPVASELALGVGWQDPAVIAETGLCVWRSGSSPVLDVKGTGDFLEGRMVPFYIRVKNTTPQRWRMNNGTTYASPNPPSLPAPEFWNATSIHWRRGVALYYSVQLDEGMRPLPDIPNALAKNIWEAATGIRPVPFPLPG